jgi:hypothetical protein
MGGEVVLVGRQGGGGVMVSGLEAVGWRRGDGTTWCGIGWIGVGDDVDGREARE